MSGLCAFMLHGEKHCGKYIADHKCSLHGAILHKKGKKVQKLGRLYKAQHVPIACSVGEQQLMPCDQILLAV